MSRVFKKKVQRSSLLSKKEIFVSHCSDDTEIMDHLTKILEDLFHSDVKVFNSYSEKSGVVAGEQLSKGLKKNLTESDLMIAIITDSYERSLKCISEISSFWYCDKPVIPIIFNGESGKRFIDDLFGFDLSVIIVDQCSSSKCSEKLVNSIVINGFSLPNRDNVKNAFNDFFETSKQAETNRPFIGSDLTYDSILKYCDKYGIRQLNNSTLSTKEIKAQLIDVKSLFIISTTGANLVSRLSDHLKHLLMSGTDITVILPNKLSDVCNDIALIECIDQSDVQSQSELNKKRISNGFEDVMTILSECISYASSRSEGHSIGSVNVCCAFTTLRQTITLAVKNDGTFWGWMSITLPPKRTIDGTPSMELYGKIGEESLANIVYEHAKAMIKVAELRKCYHRLLPGQKPINEFYLEKESARQYWQQRQDNAERNMEKRRHRYNCVLIEIAAQHPLDGEKPDIEFKKRLDFGAELYRRLSAEGIPVHIYIPGSVHCYKGISDPVSLSNAGKNYLLEKHVIPEDCIFGEEMNFKYKGDLGVYNSADECFVASEIYKNGEYAGLYCVCSPNQMLRKQLFYLAFEIIPQFYTVPCDYLAHNAIYELFDQIPDVVFKDHTWQAKDSFNAHRTRQDRMPKVLNHLD